LLLQGEDCLLSRMFCSRACDPKEARSLVLPAAEAMRQEMEEYRQRWKDAEAAGSQLETREPACDAESSPIDPSPAAASTPPGQRPADGADAQVEPEEPPRRRRGRPRRETVDLGAMITADIAAASRRDEEQGSGQPPSARFGAGFGGLFAGWSVVVGHDGTSVGSIRSPWTADDDRGRQQRAGASGPGAADESSTGECEPSGWSKPPGGRKSEGGTEHDSDAAPEPGSGWDRAQEGAGGGGINDIDSSDFWIGSERNIGRAWNREWSEEALGGTPPKVMTITVTNRYFISNKTGQVGYRVHGACLSVRTGGARGMSQA
jgi:hypothetical protein